MIGVTKKGGASPFFRCAMKVEGSIAVRRSWVDLSDYSNKSPFGLTPVTFWTFKKSNILCNDFKFFWDLFRVIRTVVVLPS